MINILVVEDDKPISDLIKMSLKRVGYLCDTALDGEIAIDKINEKTYDLILLDIMLPKVNGFEILEYIEPRKIPVIFLTAKNSVEDKVRGLRIIGKQYMREFGEKNTNMVQKLLICIYKDCEKKLDGRKN